MPTADGRYIDQISQVIHSIKENPPFAPTPCKCLECWRNRKDGATTLSYPFSFLCCQQQTFLSDVSAQRRHFSWSTFQYCFLCFVADDVCSGNRLQARRVYSHLWRCHIYLNHIEQVNYNSHAIRSNCPKWRSTR